MKKSIKAVSTQKEDLQAEKKLKGLAAKIDDLGRKSASDMFELGKTMAAAKAIVSKKRFGKWASGRCGYTVRSAWNYISVYETLWEYRSRLLEGRVSPTVMIELAKGQPDQVEQVLSAFEAGQKLTVVQVRQIVAATPIKQEAADPLDCGGIQALKKLADLKFKSECERFTMLISEILAAVEEAAIPIANGKKAVISRLVDAIVDQCRDAHSLMSSIAAPLKDTRERTQVRLTHASLPEETRWGQVQSLLYQMGGQDDWPKQAQFNCWLMDEVLPALKFVLGKDAGPSLALESPDAQAITWIDSQEPIVEELAVSDETMVDKTSVIEEESDIPIPTPLPFLEVAVAEAASPSFR